MKPVLPPEPHYIDGCLVELAFIDTSASTNSSNPGSRPGFPPGKLSGSLLEEFWEAGAQVLGMSFEFCGLVLAGLGAADFYLGFWSDIGRPEQS